MTDKEKIQALEDNVKLLQQQLQQAYKRIADLLSV
jgi:hypothetical protein